jgi:hypothetical protein
MSSIPRADVQTLFPKLWRLTVREFEVLDKKYNVQFPERSPRLIKISDSISRDAARSSTQPSMTLTKSVELFHTGRCRKLVGLASHARHPLRRGH